MRIFGQLKYRNLRSINYSLKDGYKGNGTFCRRARASELVRHGRTARTGSHQHSKRRQSVSRDRAHVRVTNSTRLRAGGGPRHQAARSATYQRTSGAGCTGGTIGLSEARYTRRRRSAGQVGRTGIVQQVQSRRAILPIWSEDRRGDV